MAKDFPKQTGGTWSITFEPSRSIRQVINEMNFSKKPLIQLKTFWSNICLVRLSGAKLGRCKLGAHASLSVAKGVLSRQGRALTIPQRSLDGFLIFTFTTLHAVRRVRYCAIELLSVRIAATARAILFVIGLELFL